MTCRTHTPSLPVQCSLLVVGSPTVFSQGWFPGCKDWLCYLKVSACICLQSKERASAFPSAIPVLVPDCLASCHRSRVFCHFTLGSLQTWFGPRPAQQHPLPGAVGKDLQRCLSPSPCTHQRGNHLSLVRPGCQLLVSCGQTPVVGDCSSLFGT